MYDMCIYTWHTYICEIYPWHIPQVCITYKQKGPVFSLLKTHHRFTSHVNLIYFIWTGGIIFPDKPNSHITAKMCHARTETHAKYKWVTWQMNFHASYGWFMSCMNESCHIWMRNVICVPKETYISPKDPYISTLLTEPYICAKDPCISAKEPYISVEEQLTTKNQANSSVWAVAVCKSIW